MTLQPGDKLGPYEIRALIGAGGMGEVYKGASRSSCTETAMRPCVARSSPEPASAPATDAVETARSPGCPSAPGTCGSAGRTAPRPECSREWYRCCSYGAEVPPAFVDVVGSQKSPSVTETTAADPSAHPHNCARRASGLVLTAYPSPTFFKFGVWHRVEGPPKSSGRVADQPLAIKNARPRWTQNFCVFANILAELSWPPRPSRLNR